VLIIEEAAYIDLRLFYEVVMPLLEMTTSVMIMISTPVNTFNFFSSLLHLKDPETGKECFLTYDVNLVCKLCRRGDATRQLECRHMMHLLPRWKSQDKMKLAELIMRDQVTTLLRESRGLVTDAGSSYFKQDEVELLVRSPPTRIEPTAYPRYVLITIDPNTRVDQSSSNMALFASTLDGGLYTVSAQRARFDQDQDRRAQRVLEHGFLQEVLERIPGALQKAAAAFSVPPQPVSIRLDVDDVSLDLRLNVFQERQEEQEGEEEEVELSLAQDALEHLDQHRVVLRRALIAIPDDGGNLFEALPVLPAQIDQHSVHVVPQLIRFEPIRDAIDHVPSFAF
jgi:hypothetical protein